MSEQSAVSNASLSKLVKRLQSLLLICLLVYVAWLSAQLSWHFAADSEESVLALGSSSPVVSQTANRRYTQLPGMHLFGKEGVKKVVASDQPKAAPKTRLRLLLKGVFTGDQGGESGAIIEELGRREAEYYRIGDKVPGNATLEEVYSDRVLLRRAGKLETLSFDEKETGGATIAQVTRPSPAPSNQNGIESPEEFLDVATRRLTEDPENALKSVGLAPGEGGGYVYQGKNPMLSGLNLEKGDVIMSVNGHTLGDVQRDKELMKSLYEQGSLEVEVVRDGASFYVNYPLR